MILIWHLFGIVLALDWLCYIMFSVVIDTKVIITRNTCLKFSLLSFSEIQCLFEDREICVFSGTSTSQHRNVVLHNTHTLTNTNTHAHTHMSGQPWLTGQVVPEEFFSGFANIFGPQVVSKNFLDRQGVTQHTKILSSES